MKSGFFPPSIVFSAVLLLAAKAWGEPAHSLLPAEPLEINGGTVKSERAKGHSAYVRVISALSPQSGEVRFKIQPAQGEAHEIVLNGSFQMLYQGIRPGPCTFTLQGKEAETTLAKVRADLGTNSYSSIWLWEHDGRVHAMFLDDNYERTKGSYRVVVRNYFPGATIGIQAVTPDAPIPPRADDLLSFLSFPKLPSGELRGFDNLPGNEFDLLITSRLPNGKTSTTVRRVNFSNGRHFSVVAAPDSYGDFDVSLLYDGPTFDAERSIEVSLVSEEEQGIKKTGK